MLEHQNIPDGSMVMGRPAKVTRALTEEEIAGVKRECTFLYRRGKETQGEKVIACKKRGTQVDKILIIEDDVEINTLLTDFLKENGYVVYSQYDGLHVLDFLHKEKIDLIILDIMLPYRSGDIILADIRRQFTIPVLIISAKETTQNKIDLLRLGADDYITKPFDMEEVLARIGKQSAQSTV